MPRRVRSEIERWLGGAVADAVSQPTGFSPGVAARLSTKNGRRVFVKAVGPEPSAYASQRGSYRGLYTEISLKVSA